MSADKYPERHKRDLLLSDRISQGTVKDIIKDIFEINFDDDEKNVLLVECLKRPGVENMAFRTKPFFTGNEFSEKKHTLLH